MLLPTELPRPFSDAKHAIVAKLSTDEYAVALYYELRMGNAGFAASFAADVNPELAAFMADSQVPWGVQALEGAVSQPSWKSKPSWYLVATDDKMIPPAAQRAMCKRAGSQSVEVKGSHAVYVSQPEAVADLIARAADSEQ